MTESRVSSSLHVVNTEQTSRRSACDRCRAAKLRCERDSTATTKSHPCRRCLKAKVACTTGRSPKASHSPQPQTPAATRLVASSEQKRRLNNPSLSNQTPLAPRPIAPTIPYQTLDDAASSNTLSVVQESLLDVQDVPQSVGLPMSHNTCDNHTQDDPMTSPLNSINAFFDMTTYDDVFQNIGLQMAEADLESLPNTVNNISIPEFNGIEQMLDFDGIGIAEEGPTDVQQTFKRSAPNSVSVSSKQILHEQCAEQLADLHSTLLRDLNLISSFKTTTDCDPSSNKRNIGNSDKNSSGHSSDHAISRMLQSTSKLLEILSLFRHPNSGHPRPSDQPHPDISEQDYSEGTASYSGTSSITTPHSHPDSSSVLQTANTEGSVDASDSSSLSGRPLKYDTPTTFSILSCYMSLIRLYRAVFSCILSTQLWASKRQLSLPVIFPGLAIGSFQLEAHVDIQLKILIQVSKSMLDKVNWALGLPDKHDRCIEDGGILEQTNSHKIFQMMIEKEEATQLFDFGGEPLKSLDEIMSKVGQLC